MHVVEICTEAGLRSFNFHCSRQLVWPKWFRWESTFQQKVRHPYGAPCYVLTVPTCKVTSRVLSEWAYATQRTSHAACTVSTSKAVALMHWHDIKANLGINTQPAIFGKWWWSLLCFSSTVKKIAMYSRLCTTSHLTSWHSRLLKVHVSGTRN